MTDTPQGQQPPAPDPTVTAPPQIPGAPTDVTVQTQDQTQEAQTQEAQAPSGDSGAAADTGGVTNGGDAMMAKLHSAAALATALAQNPDVLKFMTALVDAGESKA